MNNNEHTSPLVKIKCQKLEHIFEESHESCYSKRASKEKWVPNAALYANDREIQSTSSVCGAVVHGINSD
jgi:hypothetical protein